MSPATAPTARRSSAPLRRVPGVQVLLDRSGGPGLPLGPELTRILGPIRMRRRRSAPWVVANFATTMDGVASLTTVGASSGGEITGFLPQDRLLMGTLRAASDAIVVGAGTVRAVPRHLWDAAHIFPSARAEFDALRDRLHKSVPPCTVIVSARARLSPRLRVFGAGGGPVIVATTRSGQRRLSRHRWPQSVEVAALPGTEAIRPSDLIDLLRDRLRPTLVTLEGGPTLFGSFLAERRVDELFQTIAPQVAGRASVERPGLVRRRAFAPEDPRWGRLIGVRQVSDFLFLRWAFPAPRRSRARRDA